MAKLEESDWAVGKCPCGNNSIIRHHLSMDHGYGGGSYDDRLECSDCSTKWKLEGRFLVHLESQRQATARIQDATRRRSELQERIKSISAAVIARVYDGRAFANQSAEWEEASRAGLFQGTVKQYKTKRRGKDFLSATEQSPSSTWFVSNATPEETIEVQECQREVPVLEMEIESASASIQRRSYEQIS